MLHPERLAKLNTQLSAKQQGPPRLPLVCCGEGVMHRMRSQFDATQFGAIAVTTPPLLSISRAPRQCAGSLGNA